MVMTKNSVELVEEELEEELLVVAEGEEMHHDKGRRSRTRKQSNQTVKRHLPSGVTRVSFVSSASVWRSIVWRSSATLAAD